MSVLWNRSTFPVVVGDRGAVSRWRIPFSRQIRSKSTSPFPGPYFPVNTFPLSVNTPSGTPWRRMASAKASHTGRAVARRTTLAHTQNRELSSRPVTTDACDPSTRCTPPVMSICHNSIGRDRSHRL